MITAIVFGVGVLCGALAVFALDYWLYCKDMNRKAQQFQAHCKGLYP